MVMASVWSGRPATTSNGLGHGSRLPFPLLQKGSQTDVLRSFEKNPVKNLKEERDSVRACVCLQVLARLQLADSTALAFFFVSKLQNNHKNKNLSKVLMTCLISLFPCILVLVQPQRCFTVHLQIKEAEWPTRPSLTVGKERRTGASSPIVNNTLLFHTYDLQKEKKIETFKFRKNQVHSEMFPECLGA